MVKVRKESNWVKGVLVAIAAYVVFGFALKFDNPFVFTITIGGFLIGSLYKVPLFEE